MKLAAGEYKFVIDADGNTITYNTHGNRVHFKHSTGYEEWCEYDINGNLIHWKNSTGFEEWREYDAKGNCIHFKAFDGYEKWWEYDANGNVIHFKASDGYEIWYDGNGKKITKEQYDALHAPCHGTVVEIEGKQYKLTAI